MMTTFLLHWERFGKITDNPHELENWNDCYEVFAGPLHKTHQKVRDYVNNYLKVRPEFGKTRRYGIYKLIEVIPHG
jgi:hypothetical protein